MQTSTTWQPMPPARGWPAAAVRRHTEEADMIWIAGHVLVAFTLTRYAPLSIVHSLGVLILGLYWSLRPSTTHRTVYAAAYIAGAEVLWRMTGGTVIYEFGKYAVALLVAAAIHQMPGWRRPNGLALGFLLLLLPSISITLDALGGLLSARKDLSFNLSGPFCLALCALFFSGLDHDRLQLRRLLVFMLAPIAGISAIAGRSTLTTEKIYFGGESNFVTSGGFGPNQVSAILGLGAVLGAVLATHTRDRRWRWCFFALAALMMVQAVLTFSRGGVLNAILCIVALSLHYLPRPRIRVVLISALLFFGLVGSQVVYPALDRWTRGALTQRYADLNASVRKQIADEELALFLENPALGVGPGMSKYERGSLIRGYVAAHTEYTRLLAEHGMLGAAALLLMIVVVGWAYLRAPTAMTKAWVAVMAGWAMLEMSHAAMRIAAISFLFGLALVRWRASRAAPPPPSRS